jgi:hypothetical protein
MELVALRYPELTIKTTTPMMLALVKKVHFRKKYF